MHTSMLFNLTIRKKLQKVERDENLKSHPMYWLYNILLLIYWATLIPMLIYRLIHEEGFYQRIKQSIGFLPEELKEKISNRHAIWVHAASVGEIVAASPIVREMRKITR